MDGLTAFQLADFGVHLLLAFIWGTIAQYAWRYRRLRRPRSRFFLLLPPLATAVTLTYLLFTFITLIPPEIRAQGGLEMTLVFAFNDISTFSVVSLARHMARYFQTPEQPPASRLWLLVNYGSTVLVGLAALIFFDVIRVPFLEPRFGAYAAIRVGYQLVMLGSILWQLMRLARPGLWGSGGSAWVARRADVLFMGGALVSLCTWLYIAVTTRWEPMATASVFGLALDTIAGIGFAVPLAVRMLGEVVRRLLLACGIVSGVVVVLFGLRPLALAFVSPALQPMIDAAVLLALAAVVLPGQSWLQTTIDRFVFRRTRQRRLELQTFLRTLSPELGVPECCRRTLAQVVSVLQLRGAALLLEDGTVHVEGAIAVDGLLRIWPRGAAAQALPAHGLLGYEVRELPAALCDALTEAEIVGVVPVISPRRLWGYCFVRTTLLGAAFSEDEVRGIEAFADQVALVLDAADLVARSVAIERSLAHAEKLAAIGELAARVAHEIRNPVTAARSLAQQMARHPTSALNGDSAALILTELERVEHQVAALLRFARREEFRFEAVDLADLAAATLDALHTRLESAGICTQLSSQRGVIARADREKIRQVLINLIENAVDALQGRDGDKRLAVRVDATNGTASLCVSDSGPGVPPDQWSQLFEPFFSLKPTGTGLGLAIAKRTVDAHNGRIRAIPSSSGLTIEVDLPLAGVTPTP